MVVQIDLCCRLLTDRSRTPSHAATEIRIFTTKAVTRGIHIVPHTQARLKSFNKYDYTKNNPSPGLRLDACGYLETWLYALQSPFCTFPPLFAQNNNHVPLTPYRSRIWLPFTTALPRPMPTNRPIIQFFFVKHQQSLTA